MQEVKYHLYIIIKKGVGVTLYLSYIAILKFPNCEMVNCNFYGEVQIK